MFKFVIRDVLWLTVVIAVGVAWWIDHRQQLQRAAEQRNELFSAKSRITKLERLWHNSNELEKAIQEMGGYTDFYSSPWSRPDFEVPATIERMEAAERAKTNERR